MSSTSKLGTYGRTRMWALGSSRASLHEDTWGGMSPSAGSLAEKSMRLNNSTLLELWTNFGNVSHNIAALETREKSWFTSLPKAHPEPSSYLTCREVNLAWAKKQKLLWVLGVWQRTARRQNKSASSIQCMLTALSPQKLGGCNGINQLRIFLFLPDFRFLHIPWQSFSLPFLWLPSGSKSDLVRGEKHLFPTTVFIPAAH